MKTNNLRWERVSEKQNNKVTYANAESFDWHNGECSQQCHNNTDYKSSWNYSETEPLEQVMSKGTSFICMKKKDHKKICVSLSNSIFVGNCSLVLLVNTDYVLFSTNLRIIQTNSSMDSNLMALGTKHDWQYSTKQHKSKSLYPLRAPFCLCTKIQFYLGNKLKSNRWNSRAIDCRPTTDSNQMTIFQSSADAFIEWNNRKTQHTPTK